MKNQKLFPVILGLSGIFLYAQASFSKPPTIIDPSLDNPTQSSDFGSISPDVVDPFPESSDWSADTGSANFKCVQADSQNFATIAITPEGPTAPLINWARQDFKVSGYTPEVRCNQVTDRLNNAANKYGEGKLSNLWLHHGRVNRLPVICYVLSPGLGCNSNNVLFTVSPSSPNFKNPKKALEQLAEFSITGTGDPIQESAGRSYVDLDKWVQSASQSKIGGNPDEIISPNSTFPSTIKRNNTVRPARGGGRL